ncbi:Hypothetical predicted protein [Olea europaea subsp. europaea]|uniref:Uncharacterized protein n=1 Tax=Olea europaea subsp. europaea TaxID=158383 RepID=A0A8S0VLV4_OLEEU|nr:Hypothetical predicted protein [Olea europaea subsp. europaea]
MHCLWLEILIFEVLTTPLQANSEALMEGQIENGLKPEMKAEKRVLRPKGLKQLTEKDDKNYLIQNRWARGNPRGGGPSHLPDEIAFTKLPPEWCAGNWIS